MSQDGGMQGRSQGEIIDSSALSGYDRPYRQVYFTTVHDAGTIYRRSNMKRGLMAAAVLAVAFAVPVWATDSNPAEKGAQVKGGKPGQGAPDLKEQKAQILKGLDERIAGLQKAKKCVQAAKTDADMQSCRQQAKGAREDNRRERGPRWGRDNDRDRMRTPGGGPAPVPGTAPAPPVQGK
jgi:hypothetical protein